VTDEQFLRRGDRTVQLFLGTYHTNCYLVTMDLIYHPGWPEFEAYKVENLWQGEPHYGETNNPISNFFTNLTPVIDSQAERVKVRLTVTGHGSGGNTDDAAEFLERGRTFTVNGTGFYSLLWRDDCYLNPCRLQVGTWRYSRAGWAPGDRVDTWDIDVTTLVVPGQAATFQYVADAYTNFTPKASDPARHWVESQLISYRRLPRPTLGIQLLEGNAILTWPGGTLQSAAEADGPYADLPGAIPPWTNPPAAPRAFFRVRR
jgi:hypothetical protein